MCVSGKDRKGRRVDGNGKIWLVRTARVDRKVEEPVSRDAGSNG